MTKEQLLGILRHVMTSVGIYLVAKGLAGEGAVEEGIGSVLALASVVWSVLSKK